MPDRPVAPPERPVVPGVTTGVSPGVATRAVLPGTLVIRHDDTLGVFRPITALADDDKELVQQLADEVLRLQKRNAALEERVKALESPAHAYDEIGTAIADATDQLQRRLAASANGTTRFAVREFTIDAQVGLDVDELGSLRYRFSNETSPDDVSTGRVQLTIVPIPVDGAEAAADLRFGIALAQLPSMDDAGLRALAGLGLFTAGDLVTVGSRARVMVDLEKRLNVERATLVTWLSEAELITLPEATGDHVRVLLAAGLQRLPDVAALSAEGLVVRFDKAADAIRIDLRLASALAERWVASACAAARVSG